MRTLCLSVCILVVIQLVFGSDSIRGVAPAELSFYNQDPFKCRNEPTRTLPRSSINDNYCDCADGSDEPGTSACINGIFYCTNKGYKGTTIFASQVNDGICDCCDGSDEYEGKVKCNDDCVSKGAELQKQLAAEKEKIKKGLAIKEQWIADAVKTIAEKKASIDPLKAQVEKLKKVVEDLEAEKKGFEEKEKAEQDIINERKKELERIEQERLQKEAPPTPESEQQEQEALKQLLENKDDAAPSSEQPPLADEQPPQPPATQPEEETELLKTIREGKRKIEDELSQVRRDLSSAENDLRDTEELLKQDYGPNNEFYALRGQCFDHQTREYTYTICPYGEAKQAHTSLGKFENWEPAYTLMHFTNGQQCWGGPKRSAKVTLLCGESNELYDIQEPNKCEYAMKLNTPAACNAKPLEILELGGEGEGHGSYFH